MRKRNFITAMAVLGACLTSLSATGALALLRQENATAAIAPPNVSDLPLAVAQRSELAVALEQRDYKRAETMLMNEVARDPQSTRAAALLVAAAGIFFLDAQYLNAAIAWKKAEAIAPLDERSRFTLAMAYIKLERRDWARVELEKLSAAQPRQSIYQYWLARLDYHAQNYAAAITRLQAVIQLDPQMMRAYDSLGLCYDYLGQYDEAIKNYDRAVELNRRQAVRSPWPHVNLAISLMAVDRAADAEKQLREALSYDDKLPQSYYQLGQALEKQKRYPEAVQSLRRATELDASYPEPHYTLGRIYQKQGDKKRAAEAVGRFRQLKSENKQLSPGVH